VSFITGQKVVMLCGGPGEMQRQPTAEGVHYVLRY